MVRLDGVDDRRRLLQTASQLSSDQRVRTLHLVGHRFPDVVQKSASLGELNVGAQLGCNYARDMSRLHEVLQHVLPVGGPVVQAPQHLQHLGVEVGDAGLESRPLPRFPDRTSTSLLVRSYISSIRAGWIRPSPTSFSSVSWPPPG